VAGSSINLEVSFAYPLLSLAYVVIAFLSFFILKEQLQLFAGRE
jgi:multidrug transporter EmrE-like cation transporter